MDPNVALLLFVLVIPVVAILYVLGLKLGGTRKSGQLQRKDEQRHAEQLDWRRSGKLPVRYSTIYEPGEMVDEDMARMLELGYYVAEEGILPSGARHVIYRLGGVSAL